MKVSEYPNIWRLARKYLALPATAASSERAFSIAGLILSVKQAPLDPSTVTDLHFYVRIGNMCSHHKIDSLASTPRSSYSLLKENTSRFYKKNDNFTSERPFSVIFFC